MKHLFNLVLLLLASHLAAYAGPDDSTYTDLFIQGQVISQENNEGIPGHWVYFTGDADPSFPVFDSVKTDAGGRYQKNFRVPVHGEFFLEIFTFDCESQKHDTLLFSEYNPTDITFTICSTHDTCHASFYYIQNYLNPFLFHFYDNSGSNIQYWHYHFGDGTSSNINQPNLSHQYPGPGTYTVILFVSTTNPPLPWACYDSDTLVITILPVNFYNLAGQVFSNFFPHNTGNVVLYKEVSSGMIALDTALINSNGVYFFYHIPSSTYVVKALPGPPPGGVNTVVLLPTYYNQSLYWEQALPVSLSQNIFNADIFLQTNISHPHGPGQISGLVTLLTSNGNHPGNKTQLILLDSLDNPLHYTYALSNGNFFFHDVAYGSYKIKAEVTGLSIPPVIVSVTASTPFPNPAHVIVNTNPGVGIGETPRDGICITLFPNPAGEFFIADISCRQPGKYTSTLVTLSGSVVKTDFYSLPAGRSTVGMTVESVPAGMYFFILENPDGQKTVKRLVISRQ